MKKLALFLALFLVCGVCFADVDIGEVISWKYPGTSYTIEFSGDELVISEWNSEFEKPTSEQLNSDKKDYLESQAYFIKKFSPELAIAREAQIFDASALIRLMPVSYTLNTLISYKNFCGGVADGVPYAGLKQVGEALVSGGQILQEDYNALSNILLEQGVSLEACA